MQSEGWFRPSRTRSSRAIRTSPSDRAHRGGTSRLCYVGDELDHLPELCSLHVPPPLDVAFTRFALFRFQKLKVRGRFARTITFRHDPQSFRYLYQRFVACSSSPFLWYNAWQQAKSSNDYSPLSICCYLQWYRRAAFAVGV